MPQTEILICFDTEDYTYPHAADGILGTAKLLTEEGVRANYMMVGYVGQQLVNWRRFDVLDALKEHEINFHSKGHSMHPTIAEYCDIADDSKAHSITVKEEAEGLGMVRAATGYSKVCAGCPAGSNRSHNAMYAYGELGLGAYCDTPVFVPDGSTRWYCGLLQMHYDIGMESHFFSAEYDENALIEQLKAKKRAIVYNHPNMIPYCEFWDGVNYRGENKCGWGEWKEARRRDDALIDRFYTNLRSFIRRVKTETNPDGTPRFVFRTVSEVLERETKSRTVKRSDMPLYLDALKKAQASGNVRPTVLSETDAVPISLSECLYSAVKILLGADEVPLDGVVVKGFLGEPAGISCKASLTFDEVARCAKSIDFSGYLPHTLLCGRFKIGPMDLLTALLEFICNPALEALEVSPKSQQASLDEYPELMNQSLKGKWIFMPEFEDKYVSDRLRWQAWTMRA